MSMATAGALLIFRSIVVATCDVRNGEGWEAASVTRRLGCGSKRGGRARIGGGSRSRNTRPSSCLCNHLHQREGLPFRGRRRPVRVDRHGHVALERLSGEAVSIVVKERVDAAGIDLTGFFRPQTPCRLRYERRPGGGLDAKNQESDRARQRRHARPIRPRWRAVRRQCGGGVIVISMSSSQNVRIAFSDDLIWV